MFHLAGAGKSMMMAIAVDHLTKTYENTARIAYIYCDFKERGLQTTRNLTSNILRQLYRPPTDVFADDAIRELYELQAGQSPRMPAAECEAALKIIIPTLSTFFILVDALDELGDDERDRFMSFLSLLTTSLPCVRLMVMSRLGVDVLQAFEHLEIGRLEIAATPTDVEAYMEEQFRAKQRLLHLVKDDAQLKEEIMRGVIEKSGKMCVSPV